jgi:hypothetical protein
MQRWPRERYLFDRTKLKGWLTGLAFMVFGGMMCAAPVGAVLGLPAVAFGMYLCVTFSLGMSSNEVSPRVGLPLVALGVVLLVVGRRYAPLDALADSFREGRTVLKNPTILQALGIPILLTGANLIGMIVPWLRSPRELGAARSGLALGLIKVGGFLLLLGAVLTVPGATLAAQPYVLWILGPLGLAAGAALRSYGRPASWLGVLLLTAPALPIVWAWLALARGGTAGP